MNKKICAYLSVLVLLSTAFVNSVIAVAEIGNDIETETILPNEATGAETTKESQITQETTQSINEAVEHIEESNDQYKETEGTTTSQFPVELNDIIQPRAPNEISGQEVAPLVTDANLNNRGVQLFSNVHITDIDNNLFNQDNPPFYNDDIRIHFDWSLSDHEEIQAGDHYTYQLPDYFAVHNEVTGELQHATGGSALGQFYLNSNGELKIVFNENAENLSGRTGTIRLETELKVQTISEEIVIETGIYDRNGNEILITLPIYQVDITKSGKVNTNGAIVWDIIFNTESKGLKNVVVTDELPSGLDYSYSYGYLFDGETWVRDNTLYTYNSTHKTFTFNREINQPVKIEIYSVVNDPTIDSYRNVAKITGANFHEKSVEAEVSYHESAEYKRFLGYDEETNRATWEVSLDLSEDGATLTDRTYSGNKPEDALHYLVEDSIVVQNKKDHSSVTDWHFNHASEIRKDKQLVQFQLVFANAGQYILRYETQLFHPILTSTRLSNYITIKDDTTTSHNGSGTVVPTNKIGVAKSASTKNYQEQTVQWQIEANQHHLEVTNLVITDHYREISGANSSALELLENTLVITAMSPSGASKTLAPTDFELEKLQEIAGENIGEYESGFQIRLTGDYAKTTDKITVRFQTTFDISKQIALGSSKTRLSNSVLIDYKIGDESYKEAAQANSWLDSTWASNALKAGFFIPKGGEIQAYLQAAFNKSFSNIFSEEIASSDQVYWMGLFNTFKSPLKQGTVIVDQLEEGQTFKEIVVYTVEVSGSGNQVKSLNDKLDSSDYQWKYDSNTKVLTVELLKDTSETIAVFIAVEAAEDTYKYHNKITLTDDTLNLIAEAQVEKSAKGSWLSKNGVQNTENNRLLSWEVLINQDSRTINHAVVEDTINYNQQNFLYDEDGNVIVEVYKAIRNENQWQKGEKVSFNTENNPKVTTNGIDGTLTLSVAFEEEITSPYLIVYQTKLDPGIRNNEIVSNDVTLSGGITEIHQVTREIIVKSTNGSGTSTGTNGSLTIKKYDAEEDEESGIEKEAIFQLSRQNAEGNYEIVFPEIIVRNNKIVQGENEVDRLEGLRYGNYKIQEVQAPEGYERDEKEYTFSISSEQIDYTFSLANKKERSPVDLILEATKVLEGRKLLEGEFTFELVDEAGEVIQTQTNTSEGLIHFDTISYDTVGEHYYTLREKAGGDTTIEYDSTVFPVTVTVTDEAGQLEAKASIEGNSVFTNVYTPKTGSVVISAEKILTGRALEAGEFTFELVDETGKVIQSQTNSSDGSIYFEAISYDKAGEYHYTLREKAGGDTTIEYDSTVFPVTVTVTDEAGQLEAKASIEGNSVFTNVYTPKTGSVVISAEKILTGRALEAGEFTFELVDETGKVIQSQTNSSDGSIYFEAISYDKAGEYHYTLREKAGNDATIEYDSTAYPVTVTVTDEDGQLEATTSVEGNGVFTNVYTPKTGSVVISAEKKLTGRSLEVGEFTFELVDETGKVIQSQTNSSDGSIYFEAISYDKAGEYHYTLREKAGNDATIEYDSTVYPVTVTVTDEDGQLEATTSVEGNSVFTNVYTPKAGSVVISAEKILTGRALEAGEFTFELVDDTGKVIQSQPNSHDGNIYFEALSYDKAGEYHYTLREKVGTDETIEYASTTYPVTVTVTEVHGQLEAKVNDNKQAVFVNKSKLVSDEDTEDSGKEKPQVEEDPTEKEPKDEPTSEGKNKLPQTGELNQISWMVAGGLFVSIVGIISYYRRQSSKTK